ncbi:hypothetical protein MHK_008138 [Candidatus Magnetomorum sp. HK-1]|nr:hypothetical protein MHK_008138 [Candidatus Magnetomorum sp. HK-1]
MNEKEPVISSESRMFLGMFPNSSYFETRFEKMDNQMDEMRRNQDNFREQLRDFKYDFDRRLTESQNYNKERFSLIDKQFELSRQDMLERFTQSDKKIESSRQEMLERFAQNDKQFELSRQDMLERFAQVDKRFELVDKRFDQIAISIEKVVDKIDHIEERLSKKIDHIDEKLCEKIDQGDERQRKFTLRMFSIAISISCLSAFGIVMKVLNMI